MDERAQIELGDVITLPDGRNLSVRSVVALPHTVGSLNGFWLLGEMEVVVATPARGDQPHSVYLPVTHFPVQPDHARTAAEGSARYWAPHLPPMAGAMGEILYRIIEVRGSVDPVVVVYRGPEPVVFVRTSFAWGADIDILRMERDSTDEVPVSRHSAEVMVPSSVPAPAAAAYQEFAGR